MDELDIYTLFNSTVVGKLNRTDYNYETFDQTRLFSEYASIAQIYNGHPGRLAPSLREEDGNKIDSSFLIGIAFVLVGEVNHFYKIK